MVTPRKGKERGKTYLMHTTGACNAKVHACAPWVAVNAASEPGGGGEPGRRFQIAKFVFNCAIQL
jgi:hypothetical protein